MMGTLALFLAVCLAPPMATFSLLTTSLFATTGGLCMTLIGLAGFISFPELPQIFALCYGCVAFLSMTATVAYMFYRNATSFSENAFAIFAFHAAYCLTMEAVTLWHLRQPKSTESEATAASSSSSCQV